MKAIQEFVLAVLTLAVVASAVQQCCPDGIEFVNNTISCTDGSRVRHLCESHRYVLDSIEDPQDFVKDDDGSYSLRFVEDDEYCITEWKGNDTTPPRTVALVCYPVEFDSLDWIVLILMMISLPFLLATIAVYAGISDLRDLNGKCLIGYLVSLAVSYAVLISRAVHTTHEFCALRGAFLFFSGISMFAWLNLVTFNLWKSVRNKVYQMSDKKLFYVYLCWSVGIPLGLSFIVFVLDMIPGTPFRGHFGMFDCWYTEILGFWVLFYTPMIILIVLNLVTFGHCCWILWRGYRDPNQTRIRALRAKCVLTLRLILLSGVPWTFEIISMFAEEFVDLRYLWFFFDCINSAQGVILFLLLLVFHKRVLRAIQQNDFLGVKWPVRWGERDPDLVSISEIDKVAMDQIKDNNA